MEKNFEQQEHNEGVINLTFTKDEFREGINWAFKKNANSFNIPGFRKGKAPLNVVLNYYGEGVLYDDAINYLVNKAYIEAIQEYEITPVSQPELTVNKVSMEEGLDVSLNFDTEPVAKLGEYKGVKAVRPKDSIDEVDINNEIERVQERNARLVPVEDRAAELGDTVNIDFEGFKDSVAFEGGKGESYDLELGSGSFIPGFEDQLVGAEAGSDVEVNVTFPENYGAEDLAGADAVFKVKVNSIKHKELPELDDDFAMDISEFDTFAEYKESVAGELEERAKSYADQEFENNVLQVVSNNIDVEIPESMIEHELDHIYGYQARQMRQQGFELEQYLEMLGQSTEDFKASLRPSAENQVKMRLALKAVIETEKLELTDEDKEAEITKLVEQTGLDEEAIKSQVEGNQAFLDNVLFNKAVKFLVDNAEPISREEAEAIADETEKILIEQVEAVEEAEADQVEE